MEGVGKGGKQRKGGGERLMMEGKGGKRGSMSSDGKENVGFWCLCLRNGEGEKRKR